jgi:hypothetical protein
LSSSDEFRPATCLDHEIPFLTHSSCLSGQVNAQNDAAGTVVQGAEALARCKTFYFSSETGLYAMLANRRSLRNNEKFMIISTRLL